MEVRRLIYRRFGDPLEVLSLERCELPSPGAGELLVEMRARPINPSDLLPIEGAYRHRVQPPLVAGYEGTGVVVAGSIAEAGIAPGCRVAVVTSGTWQDAIVVGIDRVARVPGEYPDDMAAQLMINPLTAWLMLTAKTRLAPGDIVVANAARSATARLLARLARGMGLRFVGLVRGEPAPPGDAAPMLSEHDPHLVEMIRDATQGRGAAAGFDAVGGGSGKRLALLLATGAPLVQYGLLSGEPLPADARTLSGERAAATIFHLRHFLEGVDGAALRHHHSAALEALGDLRGLLPAEACHPLAEFPAAILAHRAATRRGKILLGP